MNDSEELKIMLYKFLDSLEFEYTRNFNIAHNNYIISVMSEASDSLNCLLELHKAQCEKQLINKLSVDFHKILMYNDGEVNK